MKPTVILGGGIGDVIIGLGVLKAFEEMTEECNIVTLHPEVFRFFTGRFSHLANTKESPEAYDLFISNLSFFPKEPREPNMWRIWKESNDFIEKHQLKHYIYTHPLKDGVATGFMQEKGFNRETLPAAMLGFKDVPFISKNLPRETFTDEPYITIHDGVGLNHLGHVDRATKTWDFDHWGDLVRKIREEYPKLRIAQIGSKTSRTIPGVTDNFVNRLSLSATFNILAASSLHIDGDSGMVHAARAFGVRSVVLFGPTPANYFGYAENFNIQGACSPCWWSTDTWVAKCPRGYGAPICMNSIQSDRVMIAVKEGLANILVH